jgi:hypothetical protein
MKKIIAIAAIVMSAQTFALSATDQADRIAKQLREAAMIIVVVD